MLLDLELSVPLTILQFPNNVAKISLASRQWVYKERGKK